MRRFIGAFLAVAGAAALPPSPLAAPLSAQAFDNLKFRGIGPATMSGRIDDLAVLERNPVVFYVATATGGLWKTENMGTTFTPVFDREGSSSIGDVAIAPDDANLVWVGTGENNNRQSSSWGDGVYRSADGGKSWKNMGLRASKQISRILVDPVDHDVVYVAALGDLWKAGGERGIYKTTDGGLTWSRVLATDENTGATELVMDPSNRQKSLCRDISVTRLRARGLELGIISNFDSRLFPVMRGLGIADVFDTLTISSLAQAAKPAPQIFQVALEQHAVDPEEALHIGDSLRDDVEGARKAGLHAVLLDRDGRPYGVGVRVIKSLEELFPLLDWVEE